MHKLLSRQLVKYFGSNIPDSPEMQKFICAINDSYNTNDKYFQNLENAFEITNEENNAKISNIKNAINQTALVVISDRKGQIINVNESFYKATGYSRDFIGKKNIDYFLNSATNTNISVIKECLKNENIWKGIIEIKSSNAQNIWFNCTIVPLLDINGRTGSYMSTLIDITSSKIYEDELIKSENKYKSVVNNIKEVIFQLDNNREITFLNNSWKEILGYEIHDSLGVKFCNFLENSEVEKLNKSINLLVENKINEINAQLKFLSKDNSIVWIDLYAKIIKDNNENIIGISGTLTDVTEKTKNEKLLLKSYAFQNAILNSAKQAIITTDLNGIIKTINSGAEEMIGHHPEQIIATQNIASFFFFNIGNSNKNSPFNEWINETGITNFNVKSVEKEGYIRKHNNQFKEIQLSITYIIENNETKTGYLFIANDISERKKAEIENYKLNNILEETPDYVSYSEIDGKILYTNKAYKSIRFNNNKETEHPLHPPWAEIIILKKAIPYAKKHGSWKGETAIINVNGEEVPVLQLIIVHKDEFDNPIFISSVMRDITQRKEYEHRIIQSEKRNRDLINYSQAIICTHDLNGKIQTINPAGCDLIGYQMDEMIGQNIMDFMPADLKEKFAQEYLPQFKSGKISEGILTLKHKEGKNVYLLYKNYKVIEQNGDTYIIGFAQDITERLKAENELKLSKKIAEDSSKTKEVFLANMSHEIRTPMNGIVGLTNLLLKTTLNDKQRQFANSVKQSAENLLHIINDILDFSKIHAGKLEITKREFDLNYLIYNLHQTFQIEATKKHIQLKTAIDDGVETQLFGDDIRLNQILVNLLSNAIKFTEKGYVSLKVSNIKNQKKACRIRFEITDSGIGIPNDKIENIFQSFTQANTDTTRKYGGTGLGLSIVKNLVNLLGSEIEVISKENEGSTFAFEINIEKCTDSNQTNIQKPEENLKNKLTGLKILLAEDNKVNQLFATELISDWGASIDIADNGKIALEMLQKFNYDIILMDIQMPEMSGIDATIYIRNHLNEPTKSIPIIAMTANAMKGDDQKFLSVGMNDIIFKPYEAIELYDKIEPYLKNLNSSKNSNQEVKSNELLDPNSINHVPELTVINLNTLKSFSRGKISFIIKMIGVLDEAIPEMITLLKRAIDQKDASMIRHFAHKLIPNMNMIGNIELEQTMKWIEDNALEQNTINAIDQKFEVIQPILATAIKEVKILNDYYNNLNKVTL